MCGDLDVSNSLQFKMQLGCTHINTFHRNVNIKYSVDGTKITTGNFIVEFDPKIQKKINKRSQVSIMFVHKINQKIHQHLP